MADAGARATRRISVDELIALNDEMAALVRAGIPLERVLGFLGSDMPGRLGALARRMAARLEQGVSLPDVLDENPQVFPPVYRAIVKAGLKSGRLAAALEAVAHSSRRLADARRMVASAAVYPGLVLLLAWFLATFYIDRLAPRVARFFTDFGIPTRGPLEWISQSHVVLQVAWLAAPLAVLAAGAAWWLATGRAGVLQSRLADFAFGWLPWLGAAIRSLRTATMADVLALLLEHRVPLDEAIVLAANTTGTHKSRRAASEMAASLGRGEPLGPSLVGEGGFPPLIAWLLADDSQRIALPSSLQRLAAHYRQLGRFQMSAAAAVLPTVLTLVLGGGVTVLYALSIYYPYTTILQSLARFST